MAASAPHTDVPTTQLFWHCKELVSELYDHQTLSQMEIHTGFGISGYDLVRSRMPPPRLVQETTRAQLTVRLSRGRQSEEPEYFPPVFRTPNGLMEKSPISNPEYLERHPTADEDPETLMVRPHAPIAQDASWLNDAKEPANREAYAGM